MTTYTQQLREALEKIINHKESGGFNKWHETIVGIARTALSLEVEQEGGMRWVRASEMKEIKRQRYFAKWDEDGIKGVGRFQESDGTFFWTEQGYVPILKSERDRLFILDESTPAIKEQEGKSKSLIESISALELDKNFNGHYHNGAAMMKDKIVTLIKSINQ